MRKAAASRLDINERKAVQEALRILRGEFPVRRVVLYGSKARGDSDAESDVDLLILTEARLDARQRDRISEILSRAGASRDVVLSGLVVAERDWEEGRYSVLPLKAQVQEEGVAV